MNFLTEILDTPEKRREYFQELSAKVELRGHQIWQYTPNSLLTYFANKASQLEPELFDWIEQIPSGSVLYDMGASTGLYSVYAAIKGLNVYSFEPDVLNYSIFEVNHFLNKNLFAGKLHTCNLAVSNVTKLSEMHSGRFQYGAHNKILGKAEVREGGEFYEPEHVQSVLQVSIADAVAKFGFTAPEYIKMDIDGAELNAFKGMEQVLDNVKSIFVEISESNEDTSDLLALLASKGFKEQKRFGVVQPDGSFYEGLFNVIFDRC